MADHDDQAIDYEKPRSQWGVEERVKHSQELAARREFWEKQRAAEAEQARRDGLRQEMEAYRSSKLEEWMDHGGDMDAFRREWPAMMRAYFERKEIERDLGVLEAGGRYEDLFA